MIRTFVRLFKHRRKILVALVFAGSATVLAAVLLAQRPLRATVAKTLAWAGFDGRRDNAPGTRYWCPMHPQIKRDDANDVCPICNMALVPLEGDVHESPRHLTLTARQVQHAGVVTEPVVRRLLIREIDTTGRIVCDERRQATISSWIRGKSRIEKLYVDFTGAVVEEGQLMAELYSPELIVAQHEFLMAEDQGSAASIHLTSVARQKLLDQGMTPQQVDHLHDTGKVLNRIPIYAPVGGTVFERNVLVGQYVNEGDSLFQIARLDEVWLMVDVFEEELQLVEIGQPVEVSVLSLAGKTFDGRVAFIDPMVDTESRAVHVRIEVPNRDGRLKPGMFARARLQAEFPDTLAIPESAVLWSGKRQVTLVRIGDGAFQPREVDIGHRWLSSSQRIPAADDSGGFAVQSERYHEVLAGVYPGEQVVTAGAFLLNAESQFQNVLTKMLLPAARSATLEQAIGPQMAQAIRRLLDEYYQLSNSLAHDRLDRATGYFASVGRLAEELASEAEQRSLDKLATSARLLAAHTTAVAADPTTDLSAARSHFGRVSRTMIQLLAENGGQTLFGRELFLFHCGMSNVGYENWLWWSQEKLNPYMGTKMPRCGTELEVLEP